MKRPPFFITESHEGFPKKSLIFTILGIVLKIPKILRKV